MANYSTQGEDQMTNGEANKVIDKAAFVLDATGILRTAAGTRIGTTGKSARTSPLEEAAYAGIGLAQLAGALLATAIAVELAEGDDKLTAEAACTEAWALWGRTMDACSPAIRRAAAGQLRDAAVEVRRAAQAA